MQQHARFVCARKARFQKRGARPEVFFARYTRLHPRYIYKLLTSLISSAVTVLDPEGPAPSAIFVLLFKKLKDLTTSSCVFLCV
jgi:hypothetical protein